MVLNVCDNLCQLLDLWWLQVDHLERHIMVLEAPKIDSEVV